MITNAILHELGNYDYKNIPENPIQAIPKQVWEDLHRTTRNQREPFPDFVKMLKSVTPPCKKSQ